MAMTTHRTRLATREQKVARAQELRGQGLRYREIAEEMGYAITTVQAWVKDPDRSKDIARKESYRGTCRDCGGPTSGNNGPDRTPERCLSCAQSRNAERNEKMFRLTNEGLPYWLIAKEVGCSESEVSAVLRYWRRKGRDLALHKLGGDANERAARREQIIAWRREGATNEQIAERLGTTKESVSTMFGTCRALGLDVPPPKLPPRAVKATPEELEERWAEGLTLEQIADFYGYAGSGSVSALVASLRRRGHDFPARRPGPRLAEAA